MVPASGDSLSPQAISRGSAFFLTLLGGQNAGEGDNMRIRLRLVGLTESSNLSESVLAFFDAV